MIKNNFGVLYSKASVLAQLGYWILVLFCWKFTATFKKTFSASRSLELQVANSSNVWCEIAWNYLCIFQKISLKSLEMMWNEKNIFKKSMVVSGYLLLGRPVHSSEITVLLFMQLSNEESLIVVIFFIEMWISMHGLDSTVFLFRMHIQLFWALTNDLCIRGVPGPIPQSLSPNWVSKDYTNIHVLVV